LTGTEPPPSDAPAAAAPTQARNPLHGVTLKAVVEALVAHFGWAVLAQEVPIRCFSHDPSVTSSLKFLRQTPWARDKVESLYLFMRREQTRQAKQTKQTKQTKQAQPAQPAESKPSEPD
jgi:uncharacterized protein (DUF2132 family)